MLHIFYLTSSISSYLANRNLSSSLKINVSSTLIYAQKAPPASAVEVYCYFDKVFFLFSYFYCKILISLK